MQVHQRVPLDQQYIVAFCRRHHIQRLSLFGSVLRDDFDPEASDIDFLVEFQPGAGVSLFDVGGMVVELEEKLDRTVDLRTPRDLSRYFRDEVVASAELIYAAG